MRAFRPPVRTGLVLSLLPAALALGCGGSGAAPADGGRAGAGGHGGDAAAGATGTAGRAGAGGDTYSTDGGTLPCDSNGDGLDDAPACVTAPVTLRFVNATATGTFDAWIVGASAPVATGLAPYAVATIGPVQARAIGYELRRADGARATGAASPGGGTHDTIVVYDSPATSPPSLATAWAPQPVAGTGGCAPSAANVVFGDFTSLLPAPVVVFFATNGGADWTPVVSPGLAVGEVAGSGCWTQSTPVVIGAGPEGATRAARAWQAATFGALHSYQLLLTDARIIVIDDLDAVSSLPPSTGPADAGADARD